jgi:calcium-dependent protein kinase
MKLIDHPNIVKIFDWFEDNERIYLVMEYLQGGDLHDRIISKKKSSFSDEEIASIMQQVF